MSGNAEERCDQSSMATALSCSSVKLEQTSPTAGEPAVSAGVKSASPTSTKKAWRHRLAMDGAPVETASASLASLPPMSSSTEGGGGGGGGGKPAPDKGGRISGAGVPHHAPQLQPSQLFVCRQCGKYFITLKYLEMHSALHGSQSAAAGATSQLQPAVTLIRSKQPDPPAPTGTLDRAVFLGNFLQPAPPPPAEAFLKSGPRSAPPFQPPPSAGSTTVTAAAPSAPSRYRDWTCDICRKKFSQNSSYKNHQRTHSDERPFVCTVCSIGFKERYHLKKHTLFKHSNEAREQCKFCGKRFKGCPLSLSLSQFSIFFRRFDTVGWATGNAPLNISHQRFLTSMTRRNVELISGHIGRLNRN